MAGKYEIEIEGIDAVFDIETDDENEIPRLAADLEKKYKGRSTGQIAQSMWAEQGLAPGGRGTSDYVDQEAKLETAPQGLWENIAADIGSTAETPGQAVRDLVVPPTIGGATAPLDASPKPMQDFRRQRTAEARAGVPFEPVMPATGIVNPYAIEDKLTNLKQHVQRNVAEQGPLMGNAQNLIDGLFFMANKASQGIQDRYIHAGDDPQERARKRAQDSTFFERVMGITPGADTENYGGISQPFEANFRNPDGTASQRGVVTGGNTDPDGVLKTPTQLAENVPDMPDLMRYVGQAYRGVPMTPGTPRAVTKGVAGALEDFVTLENVLETAGLAFPGTGIAKLAKAGFGLSSVKLAMEGVPILIEAAKTGDDEKTAEAVRYLAGAGLMGLPVAKATYKGAKAGVRAGKDVRSVGDDMGKALAEGLADAGRTAKNPNAAASPVAPPDSSFSTGAKSDFINPLEGVVTSNVKTGSAAVRTEGQTLPIPTVAQRANLEGQVQGIVAMHPGSRVDTIDDWTKHVTLPDGQVVPVKVTMDIPVTPEVLWENNRAEALRQAEAAGVKLDPKAEFKDVKGDLERVLANEQAQGVSAPDGIKLHGGQKYDNAAIEAEVAKFRDAREAENMRRPMDKRKSQKELTAEENAYRRQLYQTEGDLGSTPTTGGHEGVHTSWADVEPAVKEWAKDHAKDTDPAQLEEKFAEFYEIFQILNRDGITPDMLTGDRVLGEVFPKAHTMGGGEFANVPVAALRLPLDIYSGKYGRQGTGAPAPKPMTPEQRRAAAADTAARMRPPEQRPVPPPPVQPAPNAIPYDGNERRVATERRVAEVLRKDNAELTPDDIATLRTHAEENPKSGLPSLLAWEARPRAAHIASHDLDGLKHLNDKYGENAGNAMLAAFGRVTREVQGRHPGVFSAHSQGDEFRSEHADRAALEAYDKDLRETWQKTPVVIRDGHGNYHELIGLTFSTGIDTAFDKADRHMKGDVADADLQPQSKRARQVRGERAGERGGIPPGVEARQLEGPPERAPGVSGVAPRSGYDRRGGGAEGPAVDAPGERYSTKNLDPAPTFYSKLRREVEGGQNKWRPDDLLRYLKAKGVKAEEMEWAGLEDFLRDKPSVTKAEVLEHLEVAGVRVEEKVLDNENRRKFGQLQDLAARAYERDLTARDAFLTAQAEVRPDDPASIQAFKDARKEMMDAREVRDAADAEVEAARATLGESATKFSQYTLPGGENYRELLLTLPDSRASRLKELNARLDEIANSIRNDTPAGERAKLNAEWDALDSQRRDLSGRRSDGFTSSHFSEPNILAHIRFNERKGPNGEKILHIEEVQSDWHQKGREQGYANPRRLAALDAKLKAEGKLNAEEAAEYNRLTDIESLSATKGGVPDAPFKKTWPDLALKRMVRWAADNGFDRITWTTGEQQAARFDLSKQVSQVVVFDHGDGTFDVNATPIGGANGTVEVGRRVPASELAGKVGKDLAEKIVARTGEPTGRGGRWQKFSGLDLKVGGEGMKGFYDQMLPAKMQEIARKLDPEMKVGEGEIETSRPGTPEENRLASERGQWDTAVPTRATVHSIDLTPKAREAAQAGLPLFSTRQLDTPEFKAWFGDSKVVDEKGRPRVVYHGTTKDFTKFDPKRMGSATSDGWFGSGFYFTESPDGAAMFATDRLGGETGSRVVPAYLNIRRPFRLVSNQLEMPAALRTLGSPDIQRKLADVIDRYDEKGLWSEENPYRLIRDVFGSSNEFTNTLKSLGYDGVIVDGGAEIVAFSPTQIKSATGNRGTFDPTDPDIRHSTRRLDTEYKEALKESPWLKDVDANVGKPATVPTKYVRANAGRTPEERNLLDSFARTRAAENLPRVRHDREVVKEAKSRLAKDKAGEELRLMTDVRKGATRFEDVDNVILDMLRAERNAAAKKLTGEARKKAIEESLALENVRAENLTEVARALRAVRDPDESPRQRMERWFNGAVFAPKDAKTAKGLKDGDPKAIKDQVDHVEKLLEQLKKDGIDTSKWTDAQAKDPIFVAEQVRKVFAWKANFSDKVYEYWANSILSGPQTQVVNMVSNIAALAWEYMPQRLLQTAVSGAITGDKTEFDSLMHAYRALLSGVAHREGIRNAAQAWKTEAGVLSQKTGGGLAFEGGGRDYPRVAIAGTKGRVIRTPFRLLKSADEFAKGVIGQMEAAASAYKIAKNEGLSGEKLGKRMHDLILDYESEAWTKAVSQAELLTFQRELGKVGKKVMDFRNNVPIVRYVLPFVTTPYNIFATGVNKSPLGLISATKKVIAAAKSEPGFREAIKRGTPEGEAALRALTEQVIAMGATAMLGGILANETVEDGLVITGPVQYDVDDRGTRDAKYRSLPPSSFVWKDNKGEVKSASYARIEPFATILGLLADGAALFREGNKKDASDLLTEGWYRFQGQLTDKTFLRGIEDLTASIRDPKHLTRWLTNFSGSWVPNVAKQPMRATDPFVRETKLWGATKPEHGGETSTSRMTRRMNAANFPTTVNPFLPPPKRNLIGQEVQKLGGAGPVASLMRLVFPVQFGKLTKNTPKELVRFDQKLLALEANGDLARYLPAQAFPYYTVTRDDGTKKRVFMSDKQKDDFDRLTGQYLWERMQEADYFTKSGPLTVDDTKEFRDHVAAARKEAREELFSEEEEDD